MTEVIQQGNAVAWKKRVSRTAKIYRRKVKQNCTHTEKVFTSGGDRVRTSATMEKRA